MKILKRLRDENLLIQMLRSIPNLKATGRWRLVKVEGDDSVSKRKLKRTNKNLTNLFLALINFVLRS